MQRRALRSIVAASDPSLWPHGSAREGASVDDLGCVWSVATCSSGRPVDPPRQCGYSVRPLLGRAAAQRSDAPAPRSRPGRCGAPPIQARRHRRFTMLRHPARASDAIVVVNEAGRVLLAGLRRQALGGWQAGADATRRRDSLEFAVHELRSQHSTEATHRGVSRRPGSSPGSTVQRSGWRATNDALGTREGEPTHAIVEGHPEAVVVS